MMSRPGMLTHDYGGEDYSMYLDDDDVNPAEKQKKSPSHLKRKLLRLLRGKKSRRNSSDGSNTSLGPSIHEMSFADTKIGCHERGYQMYRDENGAFCTSPRGFVKEVSESSLQRKSSTRASYLNSEVLFRRQKTLPINYDAFSASLKDLPCEEALREAEGSVADSSYSESTESAEVHAPIQCPRIARSLSTSNLTDHKTWMTSFQSEPNLASTSILSCVLCKPTKRDYEHPASRTNSWISTPNFSMTEVFVEMETCVTSL